MGIGQLEERFGMAEAAVRHLYRDNPHCLTQKTCAYLVAGRNLELLVLFFVQDLKLAHPSTNTDVGMGESEREDQGAALAVGSE